MGPHLTRVRSAGRVLSPDWLLAGPALPEARFAELRTVGHTSVPSGREVGILTSRRGHMLLRGSVAACGEGLRAPTPLWAAAHPGPGS